MVSLEYLRNTVQQKRELRGLALSVVDEVILRILQKHRCKAQELNEREARLIVKEVRAQLRTYAGRFQRSSDERPSLLAERKYEKLLLTHTSTAIRLKDYKIIHQELEERNVQSILDLGCGLNPIALARKGMTYHAADIREDELALLSAFFKQEHIAGTTYVCDLRTSLPNVLSVDACLLMNVLDLVERRGHKRAETILTTVKARYFFITFSTKTLSGKPMRHPQRGWIERLFDRIGYKWQRIPLATEVLYIASVAEK